MRKDFKTGLYTLLILGTAAFSSLSPGAMSVNAKEPETAYYIDAKASSYDPREYDGRMTPVKTHITSKMSWAYASVAAAETVLNKKGLADEDIDLSEVHFAYREFKRQKGDKIRYFLVANKNFAEFCDMGRVATDEAFSNSDVDGEYSGAFTFESLYATPDTITADYELSEEQLDDYRYKVSRIYKFDSPQNNISEIKELIASLGGGYMSYKYASLSNLYNSFDACVDNDMNHYYPGDDTNNYSDESVELVGWDDDYDASNFVEKPEGNGAWLVKTSRGVNNDYYYVKKDTEYGADYFKCKTNTGSGYMWISYYNAATICFMDLVLKDDEVYEKNTFNYHINDEIDLNRITGSEAVSWRMRPENGKWSQLNDTKVQLSNLGINEYHAYDKHNNVLGEYIINVAAHDDAEYAFAVNTSRVTGECTEKDNGLDIKMEMDADSPSPKGYIYYYTFLENSGVVSNVTSSDNKVAVVRGKYIVIYNYGTAVITASYSDDMVTGGKIYNTTYTINVSDINAVSSDDGNDDNGNNNSNNDNNNNGSNTGDNNNGYNNGSNTGNNNSGNNNGSNMSNNSNAGNNKGGKNNSNSVKAVKKGVISSIKNKKAGKLKLKFDASNAVKYKIQIALNKKFTKNRKTYSTKKNSYTIKKLKKGKTYYVRVRGINSKGNGKWSKVKRIKIKE